MPRESGEAKRRRAVQINKRLQQHYPEASSALNWRNAFELLVATILSAQSTDEIVNRVIKDLFEKYPTAEALAVADRKELEQEIYSTGFYRRKAESIRTTAQKLVDEFDGQVPENMEEMLALPGVARKTANVVLNEAVHSQTGNYEGIAVDTHVKRVAYRLGLTDETDPKKVEQDLMKLLPQQSWRQVSNGLILLGRQYCPARKPNHGNCPLEDLCPRLQVP